MLRSEGPVDGLILLIRATPGSVGDAVIDIAESAIDSADAYVVGRPDGRRVLLYGVSVFARRPGVEPVDLLRRFAASPRYIEASVGALKASGFEVLPTGTNADHFDVLLVDDESEDRPLLSLAQVEVSARRLVALCGELRPNPAYAGGAHE